MSQRNSPSLVDELWSQLEKHIEHIYQGQNMSPTTKLDLYTLIYDCLMGRPLTRGRNVRLSARFILSNNVQNAGDNSCEELYSKLKNYLKTYLKEIPEEGVDLQGEDLLRYYSTHWEPYRSASTITDSIFGYFNRSWVARKRHDGRTDIYEIYHMAMEVWQSIVFQALYKNVTLACLQLIKAERKNEKIDTKLIHSVIQSYVEIDLNDKYISSDKSYKKREPTFTIYKEHFELKFLQDTAQFYYYEAIDFLVHNSMTEYLKKVAQHLNEEEQRAQSYLHPSTLNALIKHVEEVLIYDRLEAIYTEAKKLLLEKKDQDLALLFKLVNRLPNATLELKKIVEDHVQRIGSDALNDPTTGSAELLTQNLDRLSIESNNTDAATNLEKKQR